MKDGLASRRLRDLGRRIESYLNGPNRRKPPQAGLAVPVEPPRGPLPLAGGAEAPLD